MIHMIRSILLGSIAATTLLGTPSPAAEPASGDGETVITLAPAHPKLKFQRPVWYGHAGDGSDRCYVIEQRGRIRVFENDRGTEAAPVFLDITQQVRMKHNEEGLLGLAFHPEYEKSGHLYVCYSASDPRRGVLSRFTRSADDPLRADPDSEHRILEVEQPYGNHNGATLLFGPDGYLYVSFGDGGAANDPQGNGQNTKTLLGTIIRIDVDRTEGDRAYAIPPDNPFVGDPDKREEIWAYGLRNVWRMSFDRETGELWAGDVGQNKWEEIDLIVKGGNYGWNLREGKHPFASQEAVPELIDPVVEYGRKLGISVTGGYVYRGTANPNLYGAYLYADYVSGRIWALRYAEGRVTAQWLANPDGPNRHVTSFGEGPDGELYVVTFDKLDRRSGSGQVFRIAER